MSALPRYQIRAVYDEKTIRVYQAYNDQIADQALAHGTFVSPPFKMQRMTWIKPSFLWMMYRCGWGNRDEGQRRILAIDITRNGFEWALANSCPSHPVASMSMEQYGLLKNAAPVRIQWDPERDLKSHPLAHRSIQVGLGGEAIRLYVTEWIQKITDITVLAHSIHKLVTEGNTTGALAILPLEKAYPYEGPAIPQD